MCGIAGPLGVVPSMSFAADIRASAKTPAHPCQDRHGIEICGLAASTHIAVVEKDHWSKMQDVRAG